MAQRFGEEITDDQAYGDARAALKHMPDLTVADRLANSPIQKQAVADERRARAARDN